jgi:hypothetical protein
VALHTLSGGLSGGVGGAVGAMTVSSSAKTLDELQAQTAQALVDAGMSTQSAKLLSSVASSSVAIASGAVVGGATGGTTSSMVSGATTAYTTDANNRKLHPDERQKLSALKLGKSKEEQTKLDAASCYLVHCEAQYALGTPQYIQAKALYDQGAKLTSEQNLLKDTGMFTYTTKDNLSNGKFIIITTTSLSDQTKDGNERAQQTQSILLVRQRQTSVADGAAFVSKTAGQWSAASTSYGAYLNASPTAQSKAAAAVMYGQALLATEIGFGASIVEQTLRPNVGKGVTDLVVDIGADRINKYFPIGTSFTNEVSEKMKNSDSTTLMQDRLNSINNNLFGIGVKK